MLYGIDVSCNNTAAQVSEAMAVSEFVIVKAHEGLSWVDPAHAHLVAQARAAHKLVGHYSFAWTTFNPATCAHNFLNAADARAGDILALDLEHTEATTSWQHRLAWSLEWLRTVKKATGSSPVLYVNDSWLGSLHSVATSEQWRELTTYPLWLAAWNGRPGVLSRAAMYGWPCWTLHQYSDGPLADRNVFGGTVATWERLAIPSRVASSHPAAKPPAPAHPAAKPAPAPAKPAARTIAVPGLSETIILEPAK